MRRVGAPCAAARLLARAERAGHGGNQPAASRTGLAQPAADRRSRLRRLPDRHGSGLAGRVVALCHHPLCLETGMAPARASVLRRLETAALGYAAAVIVTGEATRDLLVAEFGVPAGRVTVAEPGVEPAARAAETPSASRSGCWPWARSFPARAMICSSTRWPRRRPALDAAHHSVRRSGLAAACRPARPGQRRRPGRQGVIPGRDERRRTR